MRHIDAFPVGQYVHHQKIDVVSKRRMLQPDVPRLRRADRHVQFTARLVQQSLNIVDREA